jgi:hypothetical protein
MGGEQRFALVAAQKGGEMASKPLHRPGQIAKQSGQYPLVGPRGGETDQEVTVTNGEPFPPTPKPGMGYGKPDLLK